MLQDSSCSILTKVPSISEKLNFVGRKISTSIGVSIFNSQYNTITRSTTCSTYDG